MKYQHYCDKCRYLQPLRINNVHYDVYFCNGILGGSVLARFSSTASDYWSMPVGVIESIDHEAGDITMAIKKLLPLCKPLVDKNKVEIQPGDLIRSFSFTAALRRKKHYTYHVVNVDQNQHQWLLTPVHWLNSTAVKTDMGECIATQSILNRASSEIIARNGATL